MQMLKIKFNTKPKKVTSTVFVTLRWKHYVLKSSNHEISSSGKKVLHSAYVTNNEHYQLKIGTDVKTRGRVVHGTTE